MAAGVFALFFCLSALVHIQVTESYQYNNVFTLYVSSRKNETGHTVAEASVKKEGNKVSDEWKLKVQRSLTEHEGITQFHLRALAIAPPKRPVGYTFFPGVGYYKFHSNNVHGFDEAIRICAQEGGHLAIANSPAEHQVLSTIFQAGKGGSTWAFVGFHDRITEGHHVTIFGEPLGSNPLWHDRNPDNYGNNENCGSVHRNGRYNDINCNAHLPLICEYDLSWAENWK
ncbi:hemolymph lipopolysaccharide-binding protein-like [Ischnura elegans]|uniref:hemolymph lipopolysaccharide-binding protein-like n=1 Tax=Ischnura elegans TaxID=197161 RepID=UPI001ED86B4A|nr:hemolymph lipopolysaccharide-binding protein-like [Ischnura elegans]